MLLSVDSSAVTASVALTDGERIIKNEFVKSGLTHSETLLPMIERVMQGHSFDELDALAVCAGPGSFTGVRIGVATVKGIAFTRNLPCIPVSTLEAIAHNFTGESAVICAVMDARRMQFYNALFKAENGVITRLCEDRAISAEDLKEELKSYGRVILAGDGAELACKVIDLDNIELAPEDKLYQNGVGVARAAAHNKKISADSLMPVYLRPSQAERELKLKKKINKEN